MVIVNRTVFVAIVHQITLSEAEHQTKTRKFDREIVLERMDKLIL